MKTTNPTEKFKVANYISENGLVYFLVLELIHSNNNMQVHIEKCGDFIWVVIYTINWRISSSALRVIQTLISFRQGSLLTSFQTSYIFQILFFFSFFLLFLYVTRALGETSRGLSLRPVYWKGQLFDKSLSAMATQIKKRLI